MKHTDAVKMFKALADDHRLQIMRSLADGEKCGCILLRELDIGQPTLSHHMKILCDAGLVDARKTGTWMHYSVSPEGAAHIREAVEHYVVFSAENDSVRSQRKTPAGDSCCERADEENWNF